MKPPAAWILWLVAGAAFGNFFADTLRGVKIQHLQERVSILELAGKP